MASRANTQEQRHIPGEVTAMDSMNTPDMIDFSRFDMTAVRGGEQRDRRESREWDAAQVPPSQFQRRKGSIFATPSSRGGLTDQDRDKAYHEKLKEKGWVERRNS